MKNISYFCNVKIMDKIKIFTAILLSVLTFSKIQATETGRKARFDSLQISLLTCSPHDEVYSLYGHTAIRLKDMSTGYDIAVNYGVFSFKEPNFVLRFVLGHTDYEMGIQTFQDFCQEYTYYGATVTEQKLNLTPNEKAAIYCALRVNARPENLKYRYNFLYNNCTTKARDIIVNNLQGDVVYRNKIDQSVTFRNIIHSCNGGHLWARFGNDLLMGVKADEGTSREEQQFLPANLMRDFSTAMVKRNGMLTPLVGKTETVVNGMKSESDTTRWLPTPSVCAWIMLAIILCVSATEIYVKKKLWGFDAIVAFFTGIAGLILTVMIFSQHPTVRLNLQILMLNPLALYMLYYIIRYRKDAGKQKTMWKCVAAVLTMAILCSLIQNYAEGMTTLALSLLLRAIYNVRSYGRKVTKE